MPRHEATRRAVIQVPARGVSIVAIIPCRRVETQARDDRKSVTIPRINGDPPAAAEPTVVQEITGVHRNADQTRRRQRIRHGARTIVAAVGKRAVPAAKTVRPVAKLIRRPDHTLDREGRLLRRAGHTVAQLSDLARHGGSARREEVGREELRGSEKNKTEKDAAAP